MNRSNSNNTNKDSQTNRGSSDPNASILSTDSLLSTNTTSSTINPFLAANTPRKDYSAALSILQSRYGTGGHVVPSPKTNPSNKLRDTITQSTFCVEVSTVSNDVPSSGHDGSTSGRLSGYPSFYTVYLKLYCHLEHRKQHSELWHYSIVRAKRKNWWDSLSVQRQRKGEGEREIDLK